MRRRDYQRKHLPNPLFDRQRKGLSLRWLVGGILIATVAGFGLMLLQYAGPIKTVRIASSALVSEEQIRQALNDQMQEKRLVLFKQDQTLWFNGGEAKKRLGEVFPLTHIGIDKNIFTNTLTVKFKDSEIVAIVIKGKDQFYIGLDGTIVSTVTAESIDDEVATSSTRLLRPINTESKYPAIILGEHRDWIVSEEITFILGFNSILKTQTSIAPHHYELQPSAAQEVVMVTQEGWKVYTTLTEAPATQIERLLLVLQKQITTTTNLEYIDLRFGEKVFYK